MAFWIAAGPNAGRAAQSTLISAIHFFVVTITPSMMIGIKRNHHPPPHTQPMLCLVVAAESSVVRWIATTNGRVVVWALLGLVLVAVGPGRVADAQPTAGLFVWWVVV
jgi:hypothetical protein